MTDQTIEAAVTRFVSRRRVPPSIEQYSDLLESEERLTPAVEAALALAREVRDQYDLVFYISGALTGADATTKARYTQLSELIGRRTRSGRRMFGYAPGNYTDPSKNVDLSGDEVRDIDYLWSVIVPNAQLSFPVPAALGTGAEAAWAEEHGIPVVLLVPEGHVVSRLMRGLWNVDIFTYSDLADAKAKVSKFLDALEIRSQG